MGRLERKWRNELLRFHVDYGPESLFERVKFKMKDVHELNMNGPHFNERLKKRNIPEEIVERLRDFSIEEWTVKTAEVRADRGKFYNSTWERIIDGKKYWVTIGLGAVVVTIVCKDSSGVEKCVREGDFYNYVEKVNRELMDAEDEFKLSGADHSFFKE